MTLAGSKIDSFKLYYCEKSETCIAVLLYICNIMTKVQSSNVNNDLDDTSHNKAVTLAE
jgi:hypothetical protein